MRRDGLLIPGRYVNVIEYNDEEHSQTETHYLANGIIESQTITKFDEEDRIIEEQRLDAVIKYEYEYFD